MSKNDKTYESWAKKHYGQLIGYTIEAFALEIEDDDRIFPVFLVKKGNKAFQVAVSQDEEGNGGGHLFIEDFKTD